MHTDFTANTPLDIDLAPGIGPIQDRMVERYERNTVHRTNFQARLAAGAIVGVDDRQLFGYFFPRTFFCHGDYNRECQNPQAQSSGPILRPNPQTQLDILA